MTPKDLVRAVFLDRDGVINANVHRDGKLVAPRALSDFRILPGVPLAIRQLKDAGFQIIVVTNQPDLRTGWITAETLESMHRRIREEMPIDGIKVCAHVDADCCSCRKPKPGMILEAAKERGIDLSRSYLVGDRWRDTVAGQAAGCFTFLIDYGVEQEQPHHANIIVENLRAAANAILRREREGAIGAGP